jgi:hypothetical protein
MIPCALTPNNISTNHCCVDLLWIPLDFYVFQWIWEGRGVGEKELKLNKAYAKG